MSSPLASISELDFGLRVATFGVAGYSAVHKLLLPLLSFLSASIALPSHIKYLEWHFPNFIVFVLWAWNHKLLNNN